MPLFPHSQKSDQLPRDDFADLGHSFPKPHAANPEDFQENVTYFRSELRRLSESIAWTSDTIRNRDCEHYFRLLYLVLDNLANSENAKLLTEVLRKALEQVNDVACRVVNTAEDYETVTVKMYDAALSVAETLEPLCSLDDVQNRFMVKQTMSWAMSHIQIHSRLRYGADKARWPEELVQQVREEAIVLDREKVQRQRNEHQEARERGSDSEYNPAR